MSPRLILLALLCACQSTPTPTDASAPPCPEPEACPKPEACPECPTPPPCPEPEAREEDAPAVTLGVDVLLSTDAVELLEGKRVGLITNASGVDGALVPTLDRLHGDARVDLVQLYSPEHGLRGALPAGDAIGDETDPLTGLPIQSLFGDRLSPSTASLRDLDALVFDIQDIGSRTYTYTTTMGMAMKKACPRGLRFVVLDRPNPLGGLTFEGPVIEEEHRTFVGWGPLPVSHGMTIGELARFYDEALELDCDLHVVPMQGWRRDMVWADTGLDFVATSPGIPHAHSAYLYIATGMVGGVARNVSEGVGTTQPFEAIAADWIDAPGLARALDDAELPGLRFRVHTFRPYYGRFAGELLSGVQLIVTDPHALRPLRAALTLLTTLESLHPGRFKARSNFARIWGNTRVLDQIEDGHTPDAIEERWEAEPAFQAFAEARARALLPDYEVDAE